MGGSMRASDEDKGQETSLKYTIQTIGTPFGIDISSGVLYVSNAILDFEAKQSWIVRVRATDNGILKRADDSIIESTAAEFVEIDVEIEVLDVNEPPHFHVTGASKTLEFQIEENVDPRDL